MSEFDDDDGGAESVALDLPSINQDGKQPAIVARPRVFKTEHGDMDPDNAATYLTYRMRRKITVRTLRLWRQKKQGPVYHSSPGSRHIWYREADLDEWLEICAVDPLAA